MLNYQLLLPEGTDPHTALQKLRQLSEEDPQLHILWNERLQQIHVRLMGQVQLEVLRRLIARRFGLEVDFGAGGILYPSQRSPRASAPERRPFTRRLPPVIFI